MSEFLTPFTKFHFRVVCAEKEAHYTKSAPIIIQTSLIASLTAHYTQANTCHLCCQTHFQDKDV